MIRLKFRSEPFIVQKEFCDNFRAATVCVALAKAFHAVSALDAGLRGERARAIFARK